MHGDSIQCSMCDSWCAAGWSQYVGYSAEWRICTEWSIQLVVNHCPEHHA